MQSNIVSVCWRRSENYNGCSSAKLSWELRKVLLLVMACRRTHALGSSSSCASNKLANVKFAAPNLSSAKIHKKIFKRSTMAYRTAKTNQCTLLNFLLDIAEEQIYGRHMLTRYSTFYSKKNKCM